MVNLNRPIIRAILRLAMGYFDHIGAIVESICEAVAERMPRMDKHNGAMIVTIGRYTIGIKAS